MRSVTVGRGVELTRLGFGAAPIGNLYRAIDDETAAGAVDVAWGAGVRYFDTAPHYGVGLSERRLGRALAGRRNEAVISTKVGRVLEPNPAGTGRDDQGFDVPNTTVRRWDFSADGVRRSLEASLERLGTDRVEVVYLHDPDEHWKPALTEAYPALHELREQGVIGAIGAGMNQWEMLRDFVRETDMDVIMLAGRYTLLEQAALDELLPLCVERGVGVVAAGVYNSGLLSRSRPKVGATYNYAEAPPELVARTERIADACARHGVTLPQAALAFVDAHPAVASVVIGARTAEQMAGNAEWFGAPVPAGLWSDLVAEGLLRADAPVPGGCRVTVIDAHHHLWDPAGRDYPWMAGPALAPIQRRYDADDLRGHTAKAGVDATVLVQTVSDITETEEFLATAAASDGLIAGVVGWVDLTAPDVGDQLAKLAGGPGGELLVGIRHQVEDEDDPDWLARPDAVRGLRAVGAAGLVYDLLVRVDQLPAARSTAALLGDVRFVLDHAAKPAIATGETEPWATEIDALAAVDNVACKLSGLITEADWASWTTDGIRPYADRVLAAFSPARVLFGTDWPVCELAGDYGGVVELARALTADLSAGERAAIFGATATQLYGLA